LSGKHDGSAESSTQAQILFDIGHSGNGLPACSATMYAAYQAGLEAGQ
jgi:hypothetical protein